MPCFKDRTGQSWTVELTVYDLGRFKDELGVDDSDYLKVFEAVNTPKKMLTMLWCVVEDQAKALNLDTPAFLKRIGPAELVAAGEAMRDAFLLFYPPRIGAKMKEAEAKVIEAGMRIAEGKMDAALESLNSVGVSPASSESTPIL